MAPPRKKDYPCLKCSQHCKQGSKSVKCTLCDEWVHVDCVDEISDDMYRLLLAQEKTGGGCFWACVSCRNFASKFSKLGKELDKRLTAVEEKLEEKGKEIETVTTNVTKVTDRVDNLVKNQGKIQENAAAAVFSEMRERDNRRSNLVVHGLSEPEATVTNTDERKEVDMEKFQVLCDKIECGVKVRESVRFAKRLGARPAQADQPRPLLLGLKEDGSRQKVLDNARKLADMEETWPDVSIVLDLTLMQRNEEQRLRKEAEKSNGEMSDEERKNWLYKVIGRRGERRVVKTSVEEEERRTRGSNRARGSQRGRVNRLSRQSRGDSRGSQ